MQVSKQDLNPKVADDLFKSLCHLMSEIGSDEDAELILTELLSETERIAVMKRLGIAYFLTQGWSYDKIKQTLKVSSATIATVQERMGKPGLKLARETVKVQVKAKEWSDKIKSLLKRFQVGQK